MLKRSTILQPNRANELFIPLPDEADWEKVVFKSDGGEIEKSDQKGFFVLTPNRNVTRVIDQFVKVYEGNKLLDSVAYQVPYSLIRVTPANSMIYANCKNYMKCQVLEGNAINTNVSVEVENGSLFSYNEQTDMATIIPDGKSSEVSVHVFADSELIGTEGLKVFPVPLPELKLYFGNYFMDLKEGIYLNYSKDELLNLRFITNKYFSEKYSKENNFQLEKGKITLARGKTVVLESEMKGNSMDLTDFFEQAIAGDRLVVQIEKITRTNSAGEVIQIEDFPHSIITIPLRR